MLILIDNNLLFIRMNEVRKAAIAEKASLYAKLYLLFAAIHFIFKLIHKRMKRALSNLHFFVTLLSFVLFIVIYSKMDGFSTITGQTVTRDMAYNSFMETDTLLNIIWGLFIVSQGIFVIAIIHAFKRKSRSKTRVAEETKSES